MIPCLILFVLSVFLFYREIKLDHNRFLEIDRLADEHILMEVERFKQEIGHLSNEKINAVSSKKNN